MNPTLEALLAAEQREIQVGQEVDRLKKEYTEQIKKYNVGDILEYTMYGERRLALVKGYKYITGTLKYTEPGVQYFMQPLTKKLVPHASKNEVYVSEKYINTKLN